MDSMDVHVTGALLLSKIYVLLAVTKQFLGASPPSSRSRFAFSPDLWFIRDAAQSKQKNIKFLPNFIRLWNTWKDEYKWGLKVISSRSFAKAFYINSVQNTFLYQTAQGSLSPSRCKNLSCCLIHKVTTNSIPLCPFLTFLSVSLLSVSFMLPSPTLCHLSPPLPVSCSLPRCVHIEWNDRNDFHSHAPGLRGQFQLRSKGWSRLHESGVLEPPSSL